VGIDMDPQYLSELRLERIKALGLYCLMEKASLERVKEELAFARGIYRRLRCPVIDITHLSVHDVVGKIFEYIKKKREEQA